MTPGDVLTGEAQEQGLNGIWRTVWINGFPVNDYRRFSQDTRTPAVPYVPGKAGATIPHFGRLANQPLTVLNLY
jgi:hypothetical protein